MKVLSWVQLGIEILLLLVVIVTFVVLGISRMNRPPAIQFRHASDDVERGYIDTDIWTIDFGETVVPTSAYVFDDTDSYRVIV